MPDKRITRPTGVTPAAPFSFPKLNEPDTKFKTDGEFSVKLRAPREVLQPLIDRLQPLYDRVSAMAAKKWAELPVKARKALEVKNVKAPVLNPFVTDVYDQETEEPTGEVEIKFTLPARGEFKSGKNKGRKWVSRPGIFDAKGKRLVRPIFMEMVDSELKGDTLLMKAGPAIWGGSVGKVSYEVGVDVETGEPGYFIPGTGAAGLSLRLKAVQVLKLVSGGDRDASGYGFGVEEGYEGGADEPSEAGDPGPSTEDGEGPSDGDF